MRTTEDHTFLIASSSVAGWWRSMAGDLDGCEAVHIDERSPASAGEIAATIAAQVKPGSRLVFLGSHASMRRDCEVAQLLERHGFGAFGISSAGAELGFDKLAMKRAFERFHIPTPRWSTSLAGSPAAPLRVCKSRFGTMGDGHRLIGPSGAAGASDDHYVEEFIAGTEYSVVLVRQRGRCLCFPPVWKGPTNRQLLPPFRRTRICSPLHSLGAMPARMIAISKALAEAIDFEGFLEVEFVICQAAGPLVLEINPRIAATMRMASLSAQVPLFNVASWVDRDVHLPPAALCMELPMDRPLRADLVVEGVSATSRVTIAAPTAELLFERLRRVAVDAAIPPGALAIAYQELDALLNADAAYAAGAAGGSAPRRMEQCFSSTTMAGGSQ